MNQATRLPIVLCCAEASAVALVAVVDALHRDGYAPEVVPGVEIDATLVTTAADRLRGPALFVLCQSADLDRFQVRRIEGLFSARRGPDHRMVTIEVVPRRTAAMVSELQAAARELSRSAGAGGLDDDDGRYMRDVVTPTSVASVSSVSSASIPDRGPVERGRGPRRSSSMPAPIVQAPEGISDEALGLDSGDGESDTEVVDPRDLQGGVVVAEPSVQLFAYPAARAALGADDYDTEGLRSDGVPLAVPEDDPLESNEDLVVRGAPRRVLKDHSGPVDIEVVARSSRVDPRAEADDRPLPSASSPIDIGRPAAPPPVEPAPRERRGARVLLLLFALAGMGAVVTMAVLHATAPSGTGPDDVHERGVPAVDSKAPPTKAEPTKAGPTKADPPPTKVEPVVVAEPPGSASTGEPTDAADGPPVDPPGDASSGADESGNAGTESGDGAVSPAAGDDGTPRDDIGPGPKLVPPPPTAGGPATAANEDTLEAAIADGRVRELGELLMIGTGPSTVTWDEADARCNRRKVVGLRNWRLPTKGQLGELRRAKLLVPGTYWSRSTVGEDEAFVVEAASGEATQWLKMEPNGRVVCVRSKPD